MKKLLIAKIIVTVTLVIVVSSISFYFGTQNVKKIQVEVKKLDSSSDLIIQTNLIHLPPIYPLREREISDVSYIWVESGDIAVCFNPDQSNIYFYRKNNGTFSNIYHEIIDKKNKKTAKHFLPYDENSQFSATFSVDTSANFKDICSCIMSFSNKTLLYSSDNMDGIWNYLTVRDGDVSQIYEYDPLEKKWVFYDNGD